MDVKCGRLGQRRTHKDELEAVLLSPCLRSSHCNDVGVLWELKKQQARQLPHKVRQQISNSMCELPECSVPCTALLSTKNMAASVTPSKSL